MGANVLKMEGDTKAKKRRNRKSSYYLENPKAEYLLTGHDGQGKTAYFFKVNITGLQDRIFGPYASRAMAVDCFDRVLQGALESFCDVQNVGRNKGTDGMEHIALPKDLKPVPCEVHG